MPRPFVFIVLICLVGPWEAPPASAQSWQGRILIGVNAAAPTSRSTFEDSFTYVHPYSAGIPGEEASVETAYRTPTKVMFDGGVLVRLFRNLGAGVAFYQEGSTNDLRVSARLPHPLLIGQHRAVEGTTPAAYEETGIHIAGAYVFPATRHLYLAASAGPTYFTITQRVARRVSATETYPFDTASFGSAELEALDDTGWGFHAGLDVGWMFTRTFGVGGIVRYSAATLSLTPSGRDALDIDVGGLHAGLGARVTF